MGEVASGTVADPANKTQIEIDVAVLAPARPAEQQRVISLGEAKWGKLMTLRHVERLRRARALLAVKGYDTSATRLACYSGAGFEPALTEAARSGDVVLIGLDRLYQPRP